jgi:hypothetical protein
MQNCFIIYLQTLMSAIRRELCDWFRSGLHGQPRTTGLVVVQKSRCCPKKSLLSKKVDVVQKSGCGPIRRAVVRLENIS